MSNYYIHMKTASKNLLTHAVLICRHTKQKEDIVGRKTQTELPESHVNLLRSAVRSHPYTSVPTLRQWSTISLRVAHIEKLRDYASKNDECCPCPEDSLPQGFTRRRICRQNGSVLRMVGISNRTRQQAYLSNKKCNPVLPKNQF